MDIKPKLKHYYEHHYKKLLLIPIIMLVLALLQIGLQVVNTGDFVNKGISLKGGSTITINKPISVSPEELEKSLQEEFLGDDITLRVIYSAGKESYLMIDSSFQEQAEINSLTAMLKEITGLASDDYSIEVVGSSLGESFFKQTAMALLVAFLLMGIVVSLYFRKLIPVAAVLLAAFSDIAVTLAIFNLTGIKLSTAGVAAFLMLIGYSVDTDILLTSRVLKRKDDPLMERIYGAIKTGLTMTTTTLAAVFTALLLVNNETVKQIMIILFIGLLVDSIMTWVQNAGILRLYLEKKGEKTS